MLIIGLIILILITASQNLSKEVLRSNGFNRLAILILFLSIILGYYEQSIINWGTTIDGDITKVSLDNLTILGGLFKIDKLSKMVLLFIYMMGILILMLTSYTATPLNRHKV